MEKNTPKLPRDGTVARAVVDEMYHWSPTGISFSHALCEYRDANYSIYGVRMGRNQLSHASMNLTRILKKYGHKLGKPCSKAKWVFGPKPPAPQPVEQPKAKADPTLWASFPSSPLPPIDVIERARQNFTPPAMPPACDHDSLSTHDLKNELANLEKQQATVRNAVVEKLAASQLVDRWLEWARHRIAEAFEDGSHPGLAALRIAIEERLGIRTKE
jgi:hypothetical protein